MRHIDLSLSSILKKALNEDMVQVNNPKPVGNHYSTVLERLRDAIKFRRFISLNYDDRKGDEFTRHNPDGTPKWGNPRAYRKLIPYALYYSNQNGELTLRCYHYSNNHTKRGPHRWKEMKVSGMKNVRILKDEFTEEDLPSNMNKSGDKHASEIVTMVDFNTNPYAPHEEFMSPLARERERNRRINKGESYEDLYTNQPGSIQHQPVPDVKKGRNVTNLANLGVMPKVSNYKELTPAQREKLPNYDIKAAKRNMERETGNRNALRDWDAAEAERRDQLSQQQRPMSAPQNNPGPINTRRGEDEEDWDEYLNRPNNNNF